MGRYIVRRLLMAVALLWLVSILVFALIRLIPGDPGSIMLGEFATEELRQQAAAKWGLDQPIPVQYGVWLEHVLQGDMGQSIRWQEPVLGLIVERFPATLSLTFLALVIGVTLGITTGSAAALNHGTFVDLATTFAALIGLSIPSFWLALVLMLVFSVTLHWLPAIGYTPIYQNPVEGLRTLAMPSFALGITLAAVNSRMTRSAMLDVLSQDYMRTARAKGLIERVVIVRHALRNAMMTVVTIVGMQLGVLLGGAVVIEELFSIPGTGKLLIGAVSTRDYPLIQGTVLVFAATLMLINLLVDLSYAYLDPRIRYD